jgi:hypothetical protein
MKNRKLKVFLEKIKNNIKIKIFIRMFNKIFHKNNNFSKQTIQINPLFRMKKKKKNLL